MMQWQDGEGVRLSNHEVEHELQDNMHRYNHSSMDGWKEFFDGYKDALGSL